jgi:hypothetical protein
LIECSLFFTELQKDYETAAQWNVAFIKASALDGVVSLETFPDISPVPYAVKAVRNINQFLTQRRGSAT